MSVQVFTSVRGVDSDTVTVDMILLRESRAEIHIYNGN